MEGKKYYWIKLRKDFFERDDIDFILSQEKGCEYIVLYQMLCMKASNNDGFLGTRINEMIVPYDAKKITRDCKYFDYDTILVALELYKKLGLVYEEENKVLKITDYDNLVGSETAWAEKKRLYREKQKLLGQKKDNVLEEIEKEKEIDIDKDINNKENNIKESKHKYGEYKNVLLTDKELQSLKSDYDNYEELIKYLDEYIEMKGYKAKSHYLCIKKWVIDAVKQNKNTIINKSKQEEPEWMNKENHSEQVTDEELKDLEEEMSIFEN